MKDYDYPTTINTHNIKNTNNPIKKLGNECKQAIQKKQFQIDNKHERLKHPIKKMKAN